jgi:hypothetical protein
MQILLVSDMLPVMLPVCLSRLCIRCFFIKKSGVVYRPGYRVGITQRRSIQIKYGFAYRANIMQPISLAMSTTNSFGKTAQL